jgi:hypothetical protein
MVSESLLAVANNFAVVMTNILAGALDTLREESPILSVVEKDFNGAASKQGDTVSVSIPVAQTATSVTPAATMPALADITPTNVTLTLDQWKASRFHITDKQFHEIASGNPQSPGQIAEAARAISNAVNAEVLSHYKEIYGYAGTAGTVPFASDLTAMTAVRQVLNRQLCPDGNRVGLLDYSAEANYLNLPVNQNAYQAGNNDTLVKGALNERMGFKLFRENQIPLHTAGTGASYVLNGSHTAGATSIVIKTGSGTVLVGDVVSFVGQTGTYRVVTGASAAGTIVISPGLSAAGSDGDAMTIKASHRVNLFFDPAAFAIVTRPLSGPIEGAPQMGLSQSMTDAKTGLSMRLDYLPGYHAAQWELSLLWGSKVIDPRRAARLAGAST